MKSRIELDDDFGFKDKGPNHFLIVLVIFFLTGVAVTLLLLRALMYWLN